MLVDECTTVVMPRMQALFVTPRLLKTLRKKKGLIMLYLVPFG